MLKPEPVYYNEIDKYAVKWLRNLIDAGHIAYGIVDDRSIVDVAPSDLDGFRQCHFFAGIGVWSYALRRAGVSDDAAVWTGSCPCQPFSTAGAGAGMDDRRHLWPHFHHLIRARRPALVLGEQVASKDADPWIDLVQDDMEALEYGVWSCPFPAASIGAPHIRDRMYWVAHAHDARLERREPMRQRADERAVGTGSMVDRLADTDRSARGEGSTDFRGWADGSDAQPWAGPGSSSLPKWMADPEQYITGRKAECSDNTRSQGDRSTDQRGGCSGSSFAGRGPVNGFWRGADWLSCRDDRWRPVEPGTFPLAHGAPARVGRLRAYGNAIVAEAAIAFIESVMTC